MMASTSWLRGEENMPEADNFGCVSSNRDVIYERCRNSSLTMTLKKVRMKSEKLWRLWRKV